MVVWDLVRIWRRSLVFLARGLCACSLAALYLLIGFVLYTGHHATRATPPLHLQVSLREEYTESLSLPSSVAEEGPSATPETAHVGLDAPFNTHRHPRFANGQPPVPNQQESARPLIIPKIVVQDFSAEDGSVRYKTPEYDPTHTLKRGRRFSCAHPPKTLGAHLLVNTRPRSPGLAPTAEVSAVGGLQPLYSVEGFKHRRSDVFVQNLVGFPGRKRMLGDVVAKDGSFVIVGL